MQSLTRSINVQVALPSVTSIIIHAAIMRHSMASSAESIMQKLVRSSFRSFTQIIQIIYTKTMQQ
jgi:hypothetical protein